MSRYDLIRIPLLKRALVSRWPQFLAQAAALGGFVVAILAGLWGTPVGSHNFGIVFVWIAWWALLMLAAVPLFGRGWCSVCPIPLTGEWLQRGAILRPRGRGLGLGKKWPTRFRNIWIQNGSFALVALFSAVVLTQPNVTALVLAAFFLAAVATGLLFERRAFCRYLCPVGGFIGLYSQLAPIEVRVKDRAVCAAHSQKTCYTGDAEGYGCPWQVFPGGLTKNTYCGACLECLRTCPENNVAINLRLPGGDLWQPAGRRMDEAFKAFIMLGSAVVYSAVMLGPWGALKSAAYAVGTWAWLGYAAAFIAFVFGVLPGAFALATLATLSVQPRAMQSWRKRFIIFAYALVPLGLAAWVAFSLSFVFANASYLWPALSDPLGRGWNLFGTAGLGWTPYLSSLVPALQVAVVAGGVGWASLTARRLAREAGGGRRQALPVVAFCVAVAGGLLWLLVG
ncbi:MAG: 4Fe-4S binding protein [Chloroflexi bacterium]|nr:4Fe-4S binding protein [Chloroflexota bacterium]